MRTTNQALLQVASLRTRYPWAVINDDQIIIAVFNYRAEAKQFAAKDPDHRTAFDASGVIFDRFEKELK